MTSCSLCRKIHDSTFGMEAQIADQVEATRIQSSTPQLDIIKAAVENLYRFRDHYFENHDVSKAACKNDDVSRELNVVVKLINERKEQFERENRALFHYLWGRALNVTPEYDANALDLLKKSVKLDHKLIEAWNELGECFWKKGDIDDAKNCFDGALRKMPNKVSLRNISMVLRQIQCSKDKKQANVLESVKKAKDAVNLDVSDGVSWMILGNAYLTAFFTLGQDPKLLRQCLAAYQQASMDTVAKNHPDLHYNRAVALKYNEDYQAALEGFVKAQQLDYLWEPPKIKHADLLQYLLKVQSLIENKGQLKLRRLQSFANSLVEATKHLGPYAGGSYSRPNKQSIKLTNVNLSDLAAGINKEKVVVGKVVCQVSTEDAIPFTFCMVDLELTCYSVTIYNLAEGQGVIIGDSVAIPEPFLQLVEVNHPGLAVHFNNIRVDSPMVMVVNGKKIGVNKHAPSEIGFTVRN